MKIFFASDLHAQQGKALSRYVDGIPSRLVDFLNALSWVGTLATKDDYLVVLGDVWEKRGVIDALSYYSVWRKFKELETKFKSIFYLMGNHDSYYKSDVVSPLGVPFDAGSTVATKPCIIYLGNPPEVYMHFVPYYDYRKEFLEAIDKVKGGMEGCPSILCSHIGVKGGYVGKQNYSPDEEVALSDFEPYFDLCMLGHYHKAQDLSDKTHYAGSLLQTNFGEEGEKKYVWCYDTSLKELTMIENTVSPKFITVKVSNLGDIAEGAIKGSYVRLVMTTGDLSERDILEKTKSARKVFLEWVDEAKKVEERLSFKDINNKQELVKSFLKSVGKEDDELLGEILSVIMEKVEEKDG